MFTATQITESLNALGCLDACKVNGHEVKAVAGNKGLVYSIDGGRGLALKFAVKALLAETPVTETAPAVTEGPAPVAEPEQAPLSIAEQETAWVAASEAFNAGLKAAEQAPAPVNAEQAPAPVNAEQVTESETGLGAVDVDAENALFAAEQAALQGLPDGGALITEPALLSHAGYLVLTAGMLTAAVAQINDGKPVACMVRVGRHFQPALLTGSTVIYDKALECDCVHAQAEIVGNYTGRGKIDGNLVSHKITRRTIAVSKTQGEALKALQPKSVKAEKAPATVKAGKASAEAGKAEKAVQNAEQARMKALTDLLTAGAAAGLSKAEIMTLAGLPAPAEQARQIIIATR